jgi:hypothetical protein
VLDGVLDQRLDQQRWYFAIAARRGDIERDSWMFPRSWVCVIAPSSL